MEGQVDGTLRCSKWPVLKRFLIVIIDQGAAAWKLALAKPTLLRRPGRLKAWFVKLITSSRT